VKLPLPLPRSRRARLLAGVVVLAAAGGVGGGGALLLGGGEVADEAHAAATTAHPRWLLTVDEAALPEAPVPADAPVVHPEGPDGLLTLEQLEALDGAAVVRDLEGKLRVVDGDWRAEATAADRVAGLPGLVAVEPAGEHTFLVETDLAPDQLAGLPGVVTVADEDGAPVS
jgi:hypothetical protein